MRKWINKILCEKFDYHNFQGDNWSLQCANCKKHVYATTKTPYSIVMSFLKRKKNKP